MQEPTSNICTLGITVGCLHTTHQSWAAGSLQHLPGTLTVPEALVTFVPKWLNLLQSFWRACKLTLRNNPKGWKPETLQQKIDLYQGRSSPVSVQVQEFNGFKYYFIRSTNSPDCAVKSKHLLKTFSPLKQALKENKYSCTSAHLKWKEKESIIFIA